MKRHPIRHFFANIIAGCIRDKDARKKMRVLLNSPVLDDLRFIRRDLNGARLTKIKTFIGYQARSLLISVNDAYIYKFPLRRENYRELALREKRVSDSLARVSPIKIPRVELINWRGQLIRKYEFLPGCTMRQLPASDVIKHKTKIARQIANFLHTVASSDPAEIRNLKPTPDATPGYMYGWFQGDIWDNFMLDPETYDVISFIDWEDCAFTSFASAFESEKRSPNREIMLATRREYDKIYNGK